MATQGIVESGVEQVRSAVHTANRQIRKLRKDIETRRKSVERELASSRRKLERRTQKEVARLVDRAQRLPLVKQAASLRDDAARQLESGFETVLGVFQIASRGEVERIDRKVGQLSRKLRELEKGQEAGA